MLQRYAQQRAAMSRILLLMLFSVLCASCYGQSFAEVLKYRIPSYAGSFTSGIAYQTSNTLIYTPEAFKNRFPNGFGFWH